MTDSTITPEDLVTNHRNDAHEWLGIAEEAVTTNQSWRCIDTHGTDSAVLHDAWGLASPDSAAEAVLANLFASHRADLQPEYTEKKVLHT